MAALSEVAREGTVSLSWLPSTTSSGKPAPSAPTTITSLLAGKAPGVSPPLGTAAKVVKPARRASVRNASESSSRATGAWKREPIVARTVLGLYRSAHPFERATPASKACAERTTVPTFPGSCTPCSSTTRSRAAVRSQAATSRKGKTPTGPVGVVSVERRRTSSASLNSFKGGSSDSTIKCVPSARKSRSASRCFFWLSLAARLREITGGSGVRRLAVVGLCLGSLVHVADGDAAVLAGSLDGRKIDAQLLGLALGGLGGVHLALFLGGLRHVAHDDLAFGAGSLHRFEVNVQLLGPALGGIRGLELGGLLLGGRLRSNFLRRASGPRLLRLFLAGLGPLGYFPLHLYAPLDGMAV